MQEVFIMNFSMSVKNKLIQLISQMEENCACFVKNPGKDFSRKRKLGFSQTIFFILCMEAQSLKKEILKFFNFNADAPSASALCQQRAKIKTSAFYYLMHSLDASFPKKTYKGHAIIACDGSDISIPMEQGKGGDYACRKRKNQKDYFQMHVNAMYDLINRRYLDIINEPRGKSNERQAFIEMSERQNPEPGTIFVMDRGYEGYGLIGAIHSKNMFYVIRAKDCSNGGLVKSFDVPHSGEYDKTFSRIFTFRNNETVLSHPEIYHRIHRSKSITFLDKDNPYYQMSIRILRIKVSPGTYECIITNLPSDQFTPEEIKKIYKMRWGIETSFRELKYAIGMSCLHSKKEEYIIQEILARVILYNFCEIITTNVTITQKERKYTYQINYTMAIFLCRKFLSMSDDVFHADIEELISEELLPVRPGRKYKRRLNAHPAVSFLYRTS